jgi:hypothetical protein
MRFIARADFPVTMQANPLGTVILKRSEDDWLFTEILLSGY